LSIVNNLPFALPGEGRLDVGGVPEGRDAQLIAAIAEARPGGVLHVALDDARMARMVDALAFFAPNLPISVRRMRSRSSSPRFPRSCSACRIRKPSPHRRWNCAAARRSGSRP
jgi:hypothetical protein